MGRPAVVIKGCDARAVAGLIRENQLKRDKLVLIGVRCGGVVSNPTEAGELNSRNMAQRCIRCDCREPAMTDYLVGAIGAAPQGVSRRDARLAEMESMSSTERMGLWTELLSRCTRCYACRQACPMCYCERCVTDKTEPAWIENSPHVRGNFAWHATRAIHLAGRCVDCGACERACPSHIPLGFLNRKVARIVRDRYGYTVTDDPLQQTPMGTFRLDDGEEFIV
jgi:ferredoxin